MVGHLVLTVCRLFDDFFFFFGAADGCIGADEEERGYTDLYRLQNAPLTNLRELVVCAIEREVHVPFHYYASGGPYARRYIFRSPYDDNDTWHENSVAGY